jgi:hypothetical protein
METILGAVSLKSRPSSPPREHDQPSGQRGNAKVKFGVPLKAPKPHDEWRGAGLDAGPREQKNLPKAQPHNSGKQGDDETARVSPEKAG